MKKFGFLFVLILTGTVAQAGTPARHGVSAAHKSWTVTCWMGSYVFSNPPHGSVYGSYEFSFRYKAGIRPTYSEIKDAANSEAFAHGIKHKVVPLALSQVGCRNSKSTPFRQSSGRNP